MSESIVQFPSLDGLGLSATIYRPEKSENNTILLLGHAMMANSRSMDKPKGKGFASYLVQAGYLCFLMDGRGHGLSSLSAEQGDDWCYDDLMLKDLPAAVAYIQKHYPERKIVVLGHSLFGHGSLALLGKEPDFAIDGVVSIAGNIWLPCLERSFIRKLKKIVQLKYMIVLTKIFGRFPAKTIKFGSEDEAKSYMLEFMNWWKKDTWTNTDRSWNYLVGLKNVRRPVFAIASEGDHLMCHAECSLNFVSYLKNAEVTHKIVGRSASGLSYDPGHMDLITNPKSEPVWEEIVVWLKKTFS